MEKDEDNGTEPFNINDTNFRDSNISSTKEIKEKNNRKKLYLISLGIIIFIIIVIVVFIIIYKTYKNNDKKEKNKEVIGEINCIFNIRKINTKIQILGKDFKLSDFLIFKN